MNLVKKLDDLQTPFLGNLFITNHKRGHKFLSVAKVGSTTIKTVTAHDDGLLDGSIKNSQEIHSLFGYKENGSSMLAIDSPRYPHYIRAAVYRDPVERVTSWYKDKVLLNGNDKGFNSYCLRLDIIGETDYSRIIEFLRFEVTKPHDDWIDEHLRPIARYIKPQDVDVIIKINDLDKYLEHIGCESSFIKEEQKNSTQRVKFEFPRNVQAAIREIYRQDIKLINSSSKIWQPEFSFAPIN